MDTETRNDQIQMCGRGMCAANEGHEGTCAEASGWASIEDYAPREIIEEHSVFLINRERMNIQEYLIKNGFNKAAELIPELVSEDPYKTGNPYETAREKMDRILGRSRG